jgi:ELWxxDGT repeat protein
MLAAAAAFRKQGETQSMARAFFAGVDGAGNVGLWVTHGTAASTHEITIDGAPSGGLNPSDLTVFNHHEVLFTGSAAGSG